jgi:hypothetical protein
MAQIRDAAKWKNWYPGMDTAKLFYENGMAKGVLLDDKDSAHRAYLHIIKEEPDEIIAEAKGGKLRPVINGWRAIPYPGGDSTTLQWYMDFHLRWYPWEKFSSLIFDGTYGQRIERGLLNVKKLFQPEQVN